MILKSRMSHASILPIGKLLTTFQLESVRSKVYIGEFARDLPPHWAWLGSIPPWVTFLLELIAIW